LNPIRPIGTVVAVLSLAAATTYTSPAATARETDIPFRSIVPNSWTLLPSEPQSYGRRFVSPAGDAWLWFFAVPANREAAVNANADQFPLPQLSESPTSVVAAIGLSAPDIEATEYFTGGQC
jgi:hypothetical protein